MMTKIAVVVVCVAAAVLAKPQSPTDQSFQFAMDTDQFLYAPLNLDFSCVGRDYGYYADVNNNCQVWPKATLLLNNTFTRRVFVHVAGLPHLLAHRGRLRRRHWDRPLVLHLRQRHRLRPTDPHLQLRAGLHPLRPGWVSLQHRRIRKDPRLLNLATAATEKTQAISQQNAINQSVSVCSSERRRRRISGTTKEKEENVSFPLYFSLTISSSFQDPRPSREQDSSVKYFLSSIDQIATTTSKKRIWMNMKDRQTNLFWTCFPPPLPFYPTLYPMNPYPTLPYPNLQPLP